MLIEMPYDLPGKIFRSPMPFSSYDRTGAWAEFQEKKVDLVVVLVEPQEYLVYAGRDLPAFYNSQGLAALHIPVPDFGIPADRQAWEDGLLQVTREATCNQIQHHDFDHSPIFIAVLLGHKYSTILNCMELIIVFYGLNSIRFASKLHSTDQYEKY